MEKDKMAQERLLDKEAEVCGYNVKWTSFGAGPPLIFCHGTPWSSRLWAPIARGFASSFRVYLYDMPGYGESLQQPDAEFARSYPEQTKVFCGMLQHWRSASGQDPFRPHVVAHDIGGHVALRALLLERAEYASLALVDCGAAFPVDHAFFSLVRENAAVFTALPPELHAALLREHVRSASARGLRRADEDMLVAPWLAGAGGQRAFYRQVADQRNDDVRTLSASYRPLDCPLHIIWGAKDAWVPVERAHMLHERVGGSLRIVEDAGHLVQLDAPEALTVELLRWLQGVAGVAMARSEREAE